MTVFILEGPDGGGKSSLAERLQAEIDAHIVEKIVSSDMVAQGNLRDWVDQQFVQWENTPDHLVYDRHPLISELIYGSICRGQLRDQFDHPDWLIDRLTQLYAHPQVQLVWCIPPLEYVRDNVSSQPQKVIDRCEMLYWVYYGWMCCTYRSWHNTPILWSYVAYEKSGWEKLIHAADQT